MRHVLDLLLAGGMLIAGQAGDKKFLKHYAGQSVDQLIAMGSDYRIDSLVSAFEEAILRKKETQKLSQAEVDILAIAAMEREVNNGGYHQFFLNTPEHAAILPSALERIGCPAAAKIAVDALACLKVSGNISVQKIGTALRRLGDEAVTDLGRLDDRYYQNKEEIAEKLFAYIKSKRSEITLKSATSGGAGGLKP